MGKAIVWHPQKGLPDQQTGKEQKPQGNFVFPPVLPKKIASTQFQLTIHLYIIVPKYNKLDGLDCFPTPPINKQEQMKVAPKFTICGLFNDNKFICYLNFFRIKMVITTFRVQKYLVYCLYLLHISLSSQILPAAFLPAPHLLRYRSSCLLTSAMQQQVVLQQYGKAMYSQK